MKTQNEGEMIWRPSEERVQAENMSRYMTWLKIEKGITVENYEDLWKWSVENLEAFWESIVQYGNVIFNTPYTNVLNGESMLETKWFQGATLNYTENIFAHARDEEIAIFSRSEFMPTRELRWRELKAQVASVASGLRNLGVKRGDRVAAYLPNIPETIVAFLATASIGAIWSVCSPDFGARSVIDRFQQIEPKVLIATDGYSYNGVTDER